MSSTPDAAAANANPPPKLDSRAFARRQEQCSGSLPLADLHRLGDMLAHAEGAVTWSFAASSRPRVGRPDDDRLHLTASAQVFMACVRCLEPVLANLQVQRQFRLLPDERQAALADADDDEHDALAHSPRFDLGELLEDELIMALPSAPAHDTCNLPANAGEPTPTSAGDSPETRAKPFAALGSLSLAADPPSGRRAPVNKGKR